MKNVTITNGQIASRAIATTLVLALGYFMVKQIELDEANVAASLPAVTINAPQPATIFVPHDARGLYYDLGDCGKTAAHEIYIGMPEAQILCQTGNPERVNTSTNQYGTRSQYVFDGWYVYVNNGRVTSWQQSWTK